MGATIASPRACLNGKIASCSSYLLEAASRALALHRQPAAWARLQRQAMSRDFGWPTAAARYLALYRQLRPDS